MRAAIDVPQRALTACMDMLGLLERLCGRTNRMLASDLAIATVLAEAAARAAAWNVRINLPSLTDQKAAGEIAAFQQELLEKARTLADEVRRTVDEVLERS